MVNLNGCEYVLKHASDDNYNHVQCGVKSHSSLLNTKSTKNVLMVIIVLVIY